MTDEYGYVGNPGNSAANPGGNAGGNVGGNVGGNPAGRRPEGPSEAGYPTTVISETERLASLRRLTHVLYALYAFFWLSGGISAIVAIVINYVKRDDVAGTPYEMHFTWQIRTFWWAVLWGAIGVAMAFVLIGFAVLWLLGLWTLYRVVRGWYSLYDGKALPARRF